MRWAHSVRVGHSNNVLDTPCGVSDTDLVSFREGGVGREPPRDSLSYLRVLETHKCRVGRVGPTANVLDTPYGVFDTDLVGLGGGRVQHSKSVSFTVAGVSSTL